MRNTIVFNEPYNDTEDLGDMWCRVEDERNSAQTFKFFKNFLEGYRFYGGNAVSCLSIGKSEAVKLQVSTETHRGNWIIQKFERDTIEKK